MDATLSPFDQRSAQHSAAPQHHAPPDKTTRGRKRFVFPGRTPREKLVERLMEGGLKVTGLVVLSLLFLIFAFILKEGWSAFDLVGDLGRFIGHWDEDWNTGKKVFMHTWQSNGEVPKLSFLPLMCGTVLVAVPAGLLAAVLGTGCAIFLSELAPRWAREVIKPALEMLASIPSVVIGFFCLVVLSSLLWAWVQPMQAVVEKMVETGKANPDAMPMYLDWLYKATRLNALVGAIGVSVVALPFVATLSEEALRAVPQHLRHASYALGASKWQTILRVVMPASISGLGRAWLLGLGRAMGETMIVVMAIGNAAVITLNPFESVRTMTATIAAELGEVTPGDVVYHTLFLVGSVLFLMTFLVNLLAQRLVKKSHGAAR